MIIQWGLLFWKISGTLPIKKLQLWSRLNKTIPFQPYQLLPVLKIHSCTSYTRTPSCNPQMNYNHGNLKDNFELERIFSVLPCTILLTSGLNLKLNRVGQRGILKSVFHHYSILLAIFKFYIVKFKHCNRGCQISCPTHGGLIWRPCWGKTTRVDSYQLCFQEARTLPNTKHNLEKIIL